MHRRLNYFRCTNGLLKPKCRLVVNSPNFSDKRDSHTLEIMLLIISVIIETANISPCLSLTIGTTTPLRNFLEHTYFLIYLPLRSPVLVRTTGSKSSPSAPVCSHSPDAVPIDSSVHQVLFNSGPPRLRWTTLSSATTTRGP